MNDLELTKFLARTTATRNGFPVDEVTIAHWRDVLDPNGAISYDDAVAALVLFDREDKKGFLRPAHILENITRLHRHWRDTGESIVKWVYDSITAKDVNRARLVDLGRNARNPRQVDALLKEHWDGRPERYWAIESMHPRPGEPGYEGWVEPVLERKKSLADILEIRAEREVKAISYVAPADQWMYQ